MSNSKKKKRNTLIISVIALVALIGVMVLVMKIPTETDDEIKEGSYKILTMKGDEIVKITFKNTYSEENVEFACENGSWGYTADPDFQMNQNYVKSAIEVLDELVSSRQLTDISDNLSKYGLDNPRIRVKIENEAGKNQVLLIGNTNDVTGGYYLMTEGDKNAYLVDGDVVSAFAYDVYNYGLVEEMPSISFDNLTDMRVESDDYTFHMFYDKEGNLLNESGYAKWFIEEPLKQIMGCDSNYVSETGLDTVTGMTFSKMIDYNATEKELKKYGLAEPQTTITLKYKEATNTDTATSEEELKYEEKMFKVLVGDEYIDKDTQTIYYYCKLLNYSGIVKEDTKAVGLIEAETILASMNLNAMDYVYPQIAMPVINTVDKLEIFKDGEKIVEYNATSTEVENENATSSEPIEYNGVVIQSKIYTFDVQANGKEMTEDDYKDDYAKLVGIKLEKLLLEDEEIDHSNPEYKIVYHRNEGTKKITLNFTSYNKGYYAVEKNGVTQVLANKEAVQEVLDNLIALGLE